MLGSLREAAGGGRRGCKTFPELHGPERPTVDLLAADLRRGGYHPFYDEQLTGGQSWWDQLLTQIEQCDAFVPALTQSYVESRPCRAEADYARALGKPILLLPQMLAQHPSYVLVSQHGHYGSGNTGSGGTRSSRPRASPPRSWRAGSATDVAARSPRRWQSR